jgi:hypothetical protein
LPKPLQPANGEEVYHRSPRATVAVLKRSEGELRDRKSHLKGANPMKWCLKSAYVKAMYVLVVLSSLIAAAAAGYKWY